jgi:thioredoxin 1
MQKRAAPFFVSYCQGRLLECDVLVTEAEVLAHLAHLRDFLPAPR